MGKIVEARVLRASPAGRVERVVIGGGGTRVRKHHRQPRKFHQEARALSEWGPRLSCWVPRLIATDPETLRIDLEDRPGAAPASPVDPEVAEEAARFLRALHTLEVADRDPMPLRVALERRLDAFLRMAPAWIPPAELVPMAKTLREHWRRAEMRRRACHRDFAPNNWLIATRPGEAGTGRLAVIDFEHARLDWAPLDRARLDALVFPDDPRARAAFDEAYRDADDPLGEVDEVTRAAIDRWEAARTYVWGRTHRDSDFIERGERMLEATGAGAFET